MSLTGFGQGLFTGISPVAFVIFNRYNGTRQPPCGQRVISLNTQREESVMIHERYNELLRKLELPYRPVAIKMCFEKPEVPR